MTLEIVPVNGPNRVPYLLSRKVDVVLASFSITEERKKVVAYSEPYGVVPVLVAGPVGFRRQLRRPARQDHRGDARHHQRPGTEPRTEGCARRENRPLRGRRHHQYPPSPRASRTSWSARPACCSRSGRPIRRGHRAQVHCHGLSYAVGLRKNEPELKAWLDGWVAANLKNGAFNEIYQRYFGMRRRTCGAEPRETQHAQQRYRPLKPARVIRLHPRDDVVVALDQLIAGVYVASEAVTVSGLVPPGHKMATRTLAAGEPVRRYGQIIGFASQPIRPGARAQPQFEHRRFRARLCPLGGSARRWRPSPPRSWAFPDRRQDRHAQLHRHPDQRELLGHGGARDRRSLPARHPSRGPGRLPPCRWRGRADPSQRLRDGRGGRRPEDAPAHAGRLCLPPQLRRRADHRAGLRNQSDPAPAGHAGLAESRPADLHHPGQRGTVHDPQESS